MGFYNHYHTSKVLLIELWVLGEMLMSLSLTTSDWMLLTRLIYRINLIEDREKLLEESLTLLQSVLPFETGIFSFAKLTTTGVVAEKMAGYNITSKDLVDIVQTELDHNPFLQSISFGSMPTASRGPSVKELRDSKVLSGKQKIFPEDSQYAATLVLKMNDTVVGYLVLFRNEQEQPFSRRDLCLLDEMHPHLALKVYRLFYSYKEETLSQKLVHWEQNFQDFRISKRELEVLFYIKAGLSDDEICETMFISKSTFKKHLHHIYKKVEVNNRLDLIKRMAAIMDQDM